MPTPVPPSSSGTHARMRAAPDHPEMPPAQRRRTGAEATPGPSGPLDGLATRPPGPTLPLTRERAELSQWVRQPGLLIDNRAALELSGVERLPAGPSRPAAAAPATGPRSLYLPAALPIPDAPRVRLPSGERAEVAAARSQVVGWLQELRQVAAEVHTDGASPDEELDAFSKLDKLAMPAIVAALNAERPGLNLVYAHCLPPGDNRGAEQARFGSVDFDAFVKDLRPGKWRVLADNGSHGVVLDVAAVHVPGQSHLRASVLMVNPLLSPENIRAGVVAELADQLRLPPDWPLLVAEVPAQKDNRSCRIFSLSMALKCEGTFDGLHLARLRGVPLPLNLRDIDAALARPDEIDSADGSYSNGHDDTGTDSDSDADSVRGGGRERQSPAQAAPSGPIVLGQEVLHAPQIIGPQFMKHAQSRNDVQTYIAARGPDAMRPVNKQAQTLLERHEAHRIARRPAHESTGHGQTKDATVQIFNASIEQKRIAFLDKAIRHAATADPAQVLGLASAMSNVDRHWRDR